MASRTSTLISGLIAIVAGLLLIAGLSLFMHAQVAHAIPTTSSSNDQGFLVPASASSLMPVGSDEDDTNDGTYESGSISTADAPSKSLQPNARLDAFALKAQSTMPAQSNLIAQGASSSGYIWPVKSAGSITTQFQGSNHKGIDIAIAGGSDVVAAADGYVKYVQQWDGTTTGRGGMMSYGNLVVVYHPSKGTATYYAHLRDISVSLGQQVSQYQVIGHVGSTGYSTGNHLHFELRLNAKSAQNTYGGSDGTYVNPLSYVSQSNLGPASSSHNPEGYLDVATGSDGTIRVRGWALDRDNPNATISVHVYIGGPAGQGEGHAGIVANLPRADVNNVTGVSGNHGFDAVIKTNKRGSVSVYAYGINVGGGSNTQLTNVKTVTVADPPGNAVSVLTGSYTIRAKVKPSSCLDVLYRSQENKGNVVLYDWHNGPHEKFDIVSAGGSAYYIIAQHSNKAVEVYGALTNAGANVSQYAQNKSDAQKWYFEKNDDGTYSLRNRATGLYLDVEGGATANFTNIRQWTKNDSDAERFYLVPLEVSKWSVSAANQTYTGGALTPAVTVKAGGMTLTNGTDYTVNFTNNVNVGTATATIAGKGGFTGSKSVGFTIGKKANSLDVRPVKATQAVKFGKASSIAVSKAFKVMQNTSGGKVSYKKTSGNKKITVSSAGKVTVKKGLARGTYKVVVKATSQATTTCNARTVNVQFNVKVK